MSPQAKLVCVSRCRDPVKRSFDVDPERMRLQQVRDNRCNILAPFSEQRKRARRVNQP
jgi:hypothetical protein